MQGNANKWQGLIPWHKSRPIHILASTKMPLFDTLFRAKVCKDLRWQQEGRNVKKLKNNNNGRLWTIHCPTNDLEGKQAHYNHNNNHDHQAKVVVPGLQKSFSHDLESQSDFCCDLVPFYFFKGKIVLGTNNCSLICWQWIVSWLLNWSSTLISYSTCCSKMT